MGKSFGEGCRGARQQAHAAERGAMAASRALITVSHPLPGFNSKWAHLIGPSVFMFACALQEAHQAHQHAARTQCDLQLATAAAHEITTHGAPMHVLPVFKSRHVYTIRRKQCARLSDHVGWSQCQIRVLGLVSCKPTTVMKCTGPWPRQSKPEKKDTRP